MVILSSVCSYPQCVPKMTLASSVGSVGSFSITTILPTVGRESLGRALESILFQDMSGVAWEGVIVNDSGHPLDAGVVPDRPDLRVLQTGGERVGAGVARNVGAGLARHRFLHFFDDDDVLYPDAYQAFRRAYERDPSVRWMHGGVDRVTRDGTYVDRLPTGIQGNILAQIISGEWVPLPASLLRVDSFFSAGGFDPRYPTSEDMDLLLRVAMTTELVRLEEVILRYSHGPEGSTTLRDQDVEYLLRAIESILDCPGVLARAEVSANNLYWRSQLLRGCLVSVKQNVRTRSYEKVLMRLLQAGRCVLRSGFDGLRPSFWMSTFYPYKGYDRAVQHSG